MFYVLDENKNLVEAYSKEEVVALLNKAIQDGSLEGITADAAFISKIKCCVNGITNNVAFVTSAKYNELEAEGRLQNNTAYFITDDGTLGSIDEQLKTINNKLTSQDTTISGILKGTETVGKAKEIEQTVLYDSGDMIGTTDWDSALKSVVAELLPNYKYIAVCAYGSHATKKDIYVFEGYAGKQAALIKFLLRFTNTTVFNTSVKFEDIFISVQTTNELTVGYSEASLTSSSTTFSTTMPYNLIKLIRCEKIYD